MPTQSDAVIQRELVRGLRIARRRTRQPVVLAMIGITGAGLSTIARELARTLHWSVISQNRIRVQLRERGRGFAPANTSRIAYAMLGRVLREGGNAILDSDFVEKSKRRRLERFARRFGARAVYFHLVCDRDVMLERMLRANYNPRTDIFASAAVAAREQCRRYPWHYRWSAAQGGRYTLRKPPAKVIAAVNTTDSGKWRKQLRVIAKRLRRM